MNYIKANHLSILIILFLVVSAFVGSPPAQNFGAAANVTTVGNPWVFSNTVSLSSTLAATGAVTLASNLGFTSTAGTSKIQQVSAALVAATTTPCNLQNPFTSTSTVSNIVFNVTTATSAPSQMTVATSTSKNATTSPVLYFGTSIGNQITYSTNGATSTGQSPVVPASQWVVIGSTATSSIPYTTNGVYTFGGNCQATFQTVL